MNGLAEAQPQELGTPAMDGTGSGNMQGRQMVDQVKEMLLQGATPEQLVAEGIPEEIIQMAIQELQQEIAQQSQPMPQGPGLAQQV